MWKFVVMILAGQVALATRNVALRPTNTKAMLTFTANYRTIWEFANSTGELIGQIRKPFCVLSLITKSLNHLNSDLKITS